MLTRETQQGTTLEVVQHYLTAGIEIEFPLIKQRRILKPSELHENALLTGGGQLWHFDMCLPVLRPFSQLCEPLEDGTVPAVIAAMIALPAFDFLGPQHGIAVREAPQVTGRCVYVFLELTNTLYGAHDGDWTVIISDDFSFQMPLKGRYAAYGTGLKMLKYFYAHHFAVGLEPHQYIPKAGGAPSIEREVAG